MKRVFTMMAVVLVALAAMGQTKSLDGIKIYLNPGHGGFDSNDRSCWTIPVPAEWTDSAGYWESKSNFVKALYLREMLEEAGATVIFSRETNDSGQRDMPEALARLIGVPTSTISGYFSGYDNRPSSGFDLDDFLKKYPQVTRHQYDSLINGGDRYLSPKPPLSSSNAAALSGMPRRSRDMPRNTSRLCSAFALMSSIYWV